MIEARGDLQVFSVSRVIEKPDKERATELLKDGQYLWNSGIFVWKISTFMKAIEAHTPDIYKSLIMLEASIGTSDENTVIEEIYPKLRSISIDYGIMEKASNIAVIKADMSWDDIGNWTAFEHLWKKDENSNAAMAQHFGVDTKGCIIYSPNKLVATIGIADMIIVETEGALLICHKDRVQEVKALAEKFD